MSKKMLINATHLEENRVAIVEDGILTELDIEIAGKEQTKGNIYKAVVVRVESGLQAAFVDYGGDRLGFLQMGEIHPSLFRNREDKGRPRINDILQRGQELLVQIVKEERGTKGAALTTFLSLPGRYMVLMPESDTKGVSRKIADEAQRRILKETMASLDLPEGFGYIVRTAAISQTKEELKRDFTYLQRLCESIESLNKRVKPPALVYRESNLIIRSIRDYFSTDMDEVLVDDPKVFNEARDFFQQVMPEYARLVKLHQERRPIYARYQIEEQIETISKNKVPLPSGGSIVIDSTEALVAVDVNSGKLAGEQGVEATAFRTNLEAASEVGRQLRLRDLGGLIVIDFIDMRDRKHDREVEKRLKQALKNDKARVTVGRISQFGLLEMSRQRIKAALAEGAYLSCPHCDGSGKIKSVEAQAVAFLRKVQAGIAKGQIGTVEGEIPLDVATYLLNAKREELHEMERQRDIEIFIKGRPDFVAGQAELNFQRRSTEMEKQEEEFVEAGALPEPEIPKSESTVQDKDEDQPTEDSGKRRRRRRRRKKPAADQAPAENGENREQATAEVFEEQTKEVAQEGEPATTAAAKETEISQPQDDKEKTRSSRRSRGRGRKKTAPAPEAAPAAGKIFTETTTPETTVAQGSEEEASSAEKTGKETPKATRGRRRKKSEGNQATPEPAAQPEPKVEETATPLPAAPEKEEAAEPLRTRGRWTRTEEAKEVPSGPSTDQTTEVPVGEKESAVTGDEPKRRSRKKTASAENKAGTEGEKTTAVLPIKEPKADRPESEEAPPKPARRRGRPKKAAAAPAASTPTEKAAAVSAAEPNEPEKPKRRTRKKSTSIAQTGEEQPATGEKIEERQGEMSAEKKRSAKSASATDTGEKPKTKSAEKKPAKPRATRKKAAGTEGTSKEPKET